MKQRLMLIVFAFLMAIPAMSQEIVMECSYTSNKAYRTLLVINSSGGEAMCISGDKKCHYDLEVKSMGNHVIILAKNASLSGWIDDIYIISENNKCFEVSPGMPDGNNFAKLTVKQIEGESNIAAKKREYGLTNYQGRGTGKARSN